jgi:IS1 family transposase
MARLTTERKAAVIGALVEGASVRSVERMTGVHRDTVLKLVTSVGRACERMMDEEIRHVRCNRLELDELWGFVGKKKANLTADDGPEKGDAWCWVALDPESKLIPAYHVGKRTHADALALTKTLARRVEGRVQISTDKLAAYRWAIHLHLGGSVKDSEVDYGRIVKRFRGGPLDSGRYSPPVVIGVEKDAVYGTPDLDRVSTSHVERNHLNIRMGMRRFTRLTNGFSKKLENLRAAVALHFAHYNFVRIHQTLKTTPAVASGVAGRRWNLGDLVAWSDAFGR